MVGNFGKPDATGRSSGTRSGRNRKLRSPPKGEAWAWLTLDLIASEAWRACGPNSRRLIDFLLIEHINHAATENGNLIATKEQLTEFGLSRRLVAEAISECVYFGLIRVEKGGLSWGAEKRPSRFRLTFYATKDGSPASNEWKAVTAEKVAERKAGRTRMRKAGVEPGGTAPSG